MEHFKDIVNDIEIAFESVSPDNLILGGDLNVAHSK